VNFQVTETPAEGDVLFFSEMLIPKDDYATLVEEILNGLKRSLVQRLREIQTCYFRA